MGAIAADRVRLSELPLFVGVEPDILAQLNAALRRRTLPAGGTLFQREDAGEGLVIVQDGLIRLSLDSSGGRMLTVRLAAPGDIVGEIALFDGGGRTADATALTAARVDILPHSAFRIAADRSGILRNNAMALLCQRLRATTAQLEAAALLPLEARLARIFLLLAQHGSKVEARLDGQISQSELASLAGASRPKVNGIIMRWEREGLVRRQGKAMLFDPGLMQDCAESLAP